MSEINCKYCNKSFKSYQSRSNHYKRYHNNHITLIPHNTQNITNLPQNITNLSQNTLKLVKTNNCQYCDKKLARYDSLKRHKVICKFKIINEKSEISLHP